MLTNLYISQKIYILFKTHF